MIESVTNGVKTCIRHVKEGKINWPLAFYVSLVHVAGFIGLLYIPYCHKYTLLLAVVLADITKLGITAGAHRLWSHRSYRASFPVRVFLMLAASMANQGSLWRWCRDHRVHHKYSETDADPHNAKRGFFFAHIGWLFLKKHPSIAKVGEELNFDDLAADPVVAFQKALDPWFALFMCFVIPGLVCTLWGDSFWNGYWVAGATRCVVVWHITWLVNSAAHLYGDHPYDPTSHPAENPIVSLFSLGEGWHNWHHKYPFDYAASEFGISRQFNPTKLLIDTWCALGLATERKRATGAWARQCERRDREKDDTSAAAADARMKCE